MHTERQSELFTPLAQSRPRAHLMSYTQSCLLLSFLSSSTQWCQNITYLLGSEWTLTIISVFTSNRFSVLQKVKHWDHRRCIKLPWDEHLEIRVIHWSSVLGPVWRGVCKGVERFQTDVHRCSLQKSLKPRVPQETLSVLQ